MKKDPSKQDLLDERRIAIHDALKIRSAELASYYKTAMLELQQTADTGLERARVSTICHAVRELINGLPSVMGETSSERINPSSWELLRNLPEISIDTRGEEPIVAIPRELASLIEDLARTAALESKRVRDDLTGLLVDTPQDDHPLVTPWNQTRRWFVKWAHWDRPTDEARPIPTDDQILERLRLIEDVVEARTAAFFDSRHAIDDLLAKANSEVSSK
jgi:hypothetical protein